MKAPEIPMTAGVRFLRMHGVPFTPHFYTFEEHGGTKRAAGELCVEEHAVIKTMIFQTDDRVPFVVLMHGDREVSAKQLARTMEVRSVVPCEPATAQRLTGYSVGGISPFGMRTSMSVYAERSIFALPAILINGGKRGFLVSLHPADLERTLHPGMVEVGI